MLTYTDMTIRNSFLIFILFLSFATPTLAHPGRTAADGCHYCRTNCDSWGEAWDERHCHGGGSAPVEQAAPVQQYYAVPTNTPRPLPTWTPRPPTKTPTQAPTNKPTIRPTRKVTIAPTVEATATLAPTALPIRLLEVDEEDTESGFWAWVWGMFR